MVQLFFFDPPNMKLNITGLSGMGMIGRLILGGVKKMIVTSLASDLLRCCFNMVTKSEASQLLNGSAGDHDKESRFVRTCLIVMCCGLNEFRGVPASSKMQGRLVWTHP